MLRMNVAPDPFAPGRWVVHLYARDGDEHIYQMIAWSPAKAARMALDAYDKTLNNQVKLISISSAAPEYPEPYRYMYSYGE